MSLNVLMDNGFEDELDATFGDPRVQRPDNGDWQQIISALFAQKQSPTLNAARYAIFSKSKKAPPLKNLPSY